MVRSQHLSSLTIGRLAAAGSVSVETVRFYQREGLIDVPPAGAGIRRYGTEDLRRLRFIRQAQSAGFKLKEIRELIALDSGNDRERVRELARSRIKALDGQISELKRARDSLLRLARECSETSAGPCPILASFESLSGV